MRALLPDFCNRGAPRDRTENSERSLRANFTTYFEVGLASRGEVCTVTGMLNGKFLVWFHKNQPVKINELVNNHAKNNPTAIFYYMGAYVLLCILYFINNNKCFTKLYNSSVEIQ